MKKAITLLAWLATASIALAQKAAPDGFRGPNHDGHYAESGLMKQWPSSGPQVLWTNLEIGKGYSSPTVVGDRVYITGMSEDEKQETFMALDVKTGKILYTTAYSPAWGQAYPETRTTPTIYKGKAYVISGSGEVVCLDTADGKIVWKVDGNKVYKTATGHWGTAECPLVFDDKVIYTPGGTMTTIVALDAATGKEVWHSDSKRVNRAYVTPILVEWNGKHQIIGSGAGLLFGADPATGKIQWTFSFTSPNDYENICPNSPLFKDGRVFFSQGYDTNAFMLELNADMTSVKQVWTNKDMDTHHGGYVLVDGVIYGTNWVNNNSGNWLALDWNTGKTLYNKAWSGGKGKGSIIYADGMLYCYDERRGFIGLVSPDKTDFKVVSEFRMDKGEGPNWAHLVIHDGVLYARHGSALIAYKIK